MGRFVRELKAANRLIDDQERAVGRLRQAYDDLGRTRVGAPSAPDGGAAGPASAGDINVRFTVDQSTVGAAVPGAPTATGPGFSGAAVGSAGGQGGAGGTSGVSTGTPRSDFDPRRIAAAVSGVPIPRRRDWNPRGLGGLLSAETILVTVSTYGPEAEYPLLVWSAGWLAYANPTLSSDAGEAVIFTSGAGWELVQSTGPAGGADIGKRYNTGSQRPLSGSGSTGGSVVGSPSSPGGIGSTTGAVTAAVKDSGDKTVKAIDQLGKTIAAALAGDGGASLRLQGGL